MSTTILDGEPVASAIRDRVADRSSSLRDRGIAPTLGTVMMSDAPSQRNFLELKAQACDDLGIDHVDRRVSPSAATNALKTAVGELADDPDVDAVFVQTPLPEHVDTATVRSLIPLDKDVDCFHPETMGRLVTGNPRFVPATTAAVCALLEHYQIPIAGRTVTMVGRTLTIGKPLANHLLRRGEPGNATITVCHSLTSDLAAHTRRADVVIAACGQPELIDAEMLSEGVTVVDISANRRIEDDESTVVGDVAFESARAVADAITPVPGGVGPVTIAMLLRNVVTAAKRRESNRQSTDLG
ncbi:MAG: bifunctional 5,10-methylenetetrahydrofolate dehydrogenase/5,10-methenyltetrahydrofolate cyclohydrolase [Salinirussus sp.]